MNAASTPHLHDTLIECVTDDELASVVDVIAATAAHLAELLAEPRRAATPDQPDAGGDRQHPLDQRAHELFADRLAQGRVRALLSEEADDVIMLDPLATYAVALDPLDGSSNIELNAPLGTIFTVLRADCLGLGPGGRLAVGADAIVAAGYVVYGPATVLVLSTGSGVDTFQLDARAGRFVRTAAAVRVPAAASDFAINCSNRRHWDPSIRAYIDDLVAGCDGSRATDFNMRWLAAVVGEAHRIMCRGGIYLYPGDRRQGYTHGRLRLVYEAHPLAYLMEQAGGAATDGAVPILDKVATTLHERTSLVFGSAAEVARVADYGAAGEHTGERAPLFARRGLFRA
jgi:fructose-1,6-bisphosphatase I